MKNAFKPKEMIQFYRIGYGWLFMYFLFFFVAFSFAIFQLMEVDSSRVPQDLSFLKSEMLLSALTYGFFYLIVALTLCLIHAYHSQYSIKGTFVKICLFCFFGIISFFSFTAGMDLMDMASYFEYREKIVKSGERVDQSDLGQFKYNFRIVSELLNEEQRKLLSKDHKEVLKEGDFKISDYALPLKGMSPEVSPLNDNQ